MFNIYHHNDFDGIASAAIFAKYLSITQDIGLDDIQFNSLDYKIKSTWGNVKLERPCAVLDFLYHHDADWWFDHHISTFLNETSSLNPYSRSRQKYWNTSFLSCPSLIVSHLYTYNRKLSIYLKRNYNELIKWSDIIDGARYEKPSDLFGFNNPYININKSLGLEQSSIYNFKIIKALYLNDLDMLINDSHYTDLINELQVTEVNAISIIKKLIHIENRVAYIDQSNYDIPYQRYLAYYLFPDTLYRVGIHKIDQAFSVSVNFNNWSEQSNKINLGALCRRLGGGGRFDVGAVLALTHDEALKKAEMLKLWLKKADVTQLSFDI